MENITLTEKQKEGIEIAKRRYRLGEKYTCIAGYAGTGKSTLVRFLIKELNIPMEDIAYACYTGKASLVLQQKGLPAMTLHKLLYKSFKNKDGTFTHIPKNELEYPYKLIVIDEISMCPEKIWLQALKHGVHIIALGDPFQLPPIGKDNGVLAAPHIFLTEIMRQALESEIIKLSMDIREGKPLRLMDGKDVKIISADQVVSGMYTWADQILCGKNVTRRTINSQMRRMLNKGEEPEEGDKVICLKNYWETLNEPGNPLINGMIGEIASINLGRDNGVLGRDMKIGFYPNFAVEEAPFDFCFRDLEVDYKLIKEGTPTMAKDAQPIYWKRSGFVKKPLMEFDYGYAITVHKSQGSQFDKVLLFEENINREMHSRWLYTAVTRAISKIVIVAKNPIK